MIVSTPPAAALSVAAAPVAPDSRKPQMNLGNFAELKRPVFARLYTLNFGDHAGSFASRDDAIAAARQLSAGDKPAFVVSDDAANNRANWPGAVETEQFNIYPIYTRSMGYFHNPVTNEPSYPSTDYHVGDVKFISKYEAIINQADPINETIIDGDRTIELER